MVYIYYLGNLVLKYGGKMVTIDIIFYIFVFIMGITFGSFFTLAVYRIPIKQDITHTRSYCPTCNHPLAFLDLIPVLSYLALGGKCRYCHAKIRIRYLFLELLSGLVFVLFAMPIKDLILNGNSSAIAYWIEGIFYITGLFLIAGIDKEKKEIRNEVLLYIVITETLYIIYLYISEHVDVYRYVMYLFTIVLLVVANNLYFHKKAKNNYTIQCLILMVATILFTYAQLTVLTVIFMLLSIGVYECITVMNRKKFIKKDNTENKERELPIGFFLCTCNLIILLVVNFLAFSTI